MESALQIFISYSREDAATADALVEALTGRGFGVTIDRRDLPFGEKWQLELEDFIRQSDTVIWLVSEASVRSEWVNWELDEVARRSKRLVPISIGYLRHEALPRQLREIHMLPATGVFELERDLDTLVAVLETDRVWLKEASRLQDRATEWQAKDRTSSLLLSRGALVAAENWKDRRPTKAPAPAPEVLELLLASRQAATKRQRLWVTGSAAVAVIAVALSSLALWQTYRAKTQRDQALRTQSLFLADLARQYTNERDPVTGLQLAVEALPDPSANIERPYVVGALNSLYHALYETNEVALLLPNRSRRFWEYVSSVAFSPKGLHALTVSSDGSTRIWDLAQGSLPLEITGRKDNAWAYGAFSPDGSKVATNASISDAISGGLIAPLPDHDATVKHVEFSPNKLYGLTASGDPFNDDNVVRIWDAASGIEIAQLDHETVVADATFSPRGNLVATASSDAAVRIWDTSFGDPLKVLRDPQLSKNVTSVEFSADGSLLLATSLNGSPVIWNVATWKPRRLVFDKNHWIATLSADGKLLATGTLESIAYIFRLDRLRRRGPEGTLIPAQEFRGHQDRINKLAFTADGQRLITASDDGTARLWDIQTGALIRVFKGHRDGIEAIALDPDDSFLLTGSKDGTARVWRLDHPDHIVLPHESLVSSFSLDDSGETILTVAPQSKKVRVWHGGDGTLIGELLGHEGPVSGAAYLADGSRIVTIAGSCLDNERSARIFETATMRKLAEVQSIDGPFSNFAVSTKGTFLALVADKITEKSEGKCGTTGGNQVLIVDTRDTSRKSILLDHAAAITSIRFSANGQLLGSTSTDQSVRIWDAATGQPLMLLSENEGYPIDIAFSPDDSNIASSFSDNVVRIWRRADGELVHTLRGHSGPVSSVQFNHDGTLLAASVSDGDFENQEVRIWNVVSGEQLLRLESRSGGLGKFAQFSPDSKRILTIGTLLQDKTGKSLLTDVAQVWNVATGELELIVDYGSITAARFDSSGNWLIASSNDKTVRLFRLFASSQEAIVRAKSTIKRCMTSLEREKTFLSPASPDWCEAARTTSN